MVYKGNKITIYEMNKLLDEFPEDTELKELKSLEEANRKMLLNSKVFEKNGKKYYQN